MKKSVVFILSVILASALLYSCGGSSSGTTATVTTQSYNGPGSRWAIAFHSDGSFDCTESDSGLEIGGTWTETTSGFKELTVTATNNASAVAVDSRGYGLEIPGVVFILKPFDGDQIIVMVEAGQCPTTDISANWIVTNNHTDVINSDVMGTFAYTHSDASAVLPAKYYLDGGLAGTAESIGQFSCSDGTATVNDATMYFTQLGGAIVHTNAGTPDDKSDDQFIVALPANEIGDVNNLDGDYIGLVFAGGVSEDELFPVAVSLSGGSGTGNEILDHDTGDLSGDTVAIVIDSTVDSPSDGFISATIGGAPMRAMGSVNVNGSGKNFLFCIGENPGEAGYLYNLLLISK